MLKKKYLLFKKKKKACQDIVTRDECQKVHGSTFSQEFPLQCSVLACGTPSSRSNQLNSLIICLFTTYTKLALHLITSCVLWALGAGALMLRVRYVVWSPRLVLGIHSWLTLTCYISSFKSLSFCHPTFLIFKWVIIILTHTGRLWRNAN